MNKKFLKKGNGEFIGFTIIALVIVMLFIPMCAIFKLALGLYDVNKMLMASSRAAAVCTSMDDAQKQAELVAETTSDNSSVEQIETEVKFADGFSKWESGVSIVVTVKAKVKTMDAVLSSRTYSKSIPVTIENLDGLSGSNCQEQVFNYLKQNGFTDEAACGVLGNIEQESGFDATRMQGDGPAAGLCQWENFRMKSERWKNLDNFAKARGKEWTDLSCQLDFMIYELSGGESAAGILKTMYPNGFEGLKEDTNINQATYNFCFSFERPNRELANLEGRYAAAHKYYNQFHR